MQDRCVVLPCPGSGGVLFTFFPGTVMVLDWVGSALSPTQPPIGQAKELRRCSLGCTIGMARANTIIYLWYILPLSAEVWQPVAAGDFPPWTGVRVGEAAVPGPGCQLRLLSANVTSLAARGCDLLRLQPDLVLVQEARVGRDPGGPPAKYAAQGYHLRGRLMDIGMPPWPFRGIDRMRSCPLWVLAFLYCCSLGLRYSF